MSLNAPHKKISAREAAYLAVLASLQEEKFVNESLEAWLRLSLPKEADFRLAQEIAYGTIRMALSLDFYARELTDSGKLSLKLKEKALLRTALYQQVFMSRVPLFAITDESVKIAKKTCHPRFTSFLNMLLRKSAVKPFETPQGNSIEALSIRFSYPKFFIERLFDKFTVEEVLKILEHGNKPSSVTLRLRPECEREFYENSAFEFMHRDPYFLLLKDTTQLTSLIQRKDCYVQNPTPALLLWSLSKDIDKHTPLKILDLCASPGGKLLAAHDLFPKSILYANDVSDSKIKKVHENCLKYDIQAHLSVQNGEEFKTAEKFDIVIVDAPCSNTGVLNKRAEARWRLNPVNLKEQVNLQKKLILKALELLTPLGEVWYMTCSLLSEENQEISGIFKNCTKETFILPSGVNDGGYAVSIKP